MQRFFRFLKNLLLLIIMPALIYLLLNLIGAIIPVNSGSGSEKGNIKIYLIQNGTHTDIVLPVSNQIQNWKETIPSSNFSTPRQTAYYAFGWGDREFYRTTPQWDDLEITTAVNSLFLNTPSAIHVTRMDFPQTRNHIQLKLTEAQYQKLSEYILKHFERNVNGNPVQLDFSYTQDDIFFESKSSFHAFRTCNTWVNSAMKYAGLEACLWTAFSQVIFWKYS
ncbi:TIGR02117 family protein [Gramella sp. BOM4]|nr:TIGR02117 family protein [Christiangramia bathymodioli]